MNYFPSREGKLVVTFIMSITVLSLFSLYPLRPMPLVTDHSLLLLRMPLPYKSEEMYLDIIRAHLPFLNVLHGKVGRLEKGER